MRMQNEQPRNRKRINNVILLRAMSQDPSHVAEGFRKIGTRQLGSFEDFVNSFLLKLFFNCRDIRKQISG